MYFLWINFLILLQTLTDIVDYLIFIILLKMSKNIHSTYLLHAINIDPNLEKSKYFQGFIDQNYYVLVLEYIINQF